jgi:DNA-binding transcriptional LysR family regulator
LASSPAIKKPEDLKRHSVLYPTRFNEPAVWTYHRNDRPFAIKLTPRFQSNQNRAAINAAIAGVGVVRLMSYQVAEALRSGDLVSLLEDVEDKKLPIQVVSVEGRKNLTKVKMFIDYVKAGLANNEYLNPRV